MPPPIFIDNENIEEVANRLKTCSRVLVLTGAGISQESGVPTFRGKDGLWETHKAEDLATPQAFERDPALVWKWYDWRRGLIKPLQPNPAHHALAALEERVRDFSLVTQNVDGLHRLAGSKNLIEIHGALWQVRCTACGTKSENRDVPIAIPPMCASCGGMLRPDVVWFGEALDPELLARVFRLLAHTELMLVVGTSGLVEPAASFGLFAKRSGAFVVEINRSRTPQSAFFDRSLEGKAGDILPRLVSSVTRETTT